jgi:hypothetical protein
VTPTAVPTRRLLGEATVAAVAAVVAAAVHLRWWQARWREPWLLFNDSIYYQAHVQGMLDHGTYLDNPNLGWPFGLDLRDLPEGGENLHWAVLRLLGAIGGTSWALNVFFVLTFATTAWTAHLVLRLLGVRAFTAGIGAVLFAFAPYHFVRGQLHIFLSSYALVPVGVLLAVWLLGDDPPRSWRDRRLWWAAAAMVGLASTGAYYLTFTAVLVVLGAAVAAVRDRRWAPVASAVALVGVGAVVVAANVAPSLWHWATEGTNPAVANRSVFETEHYGLRLFQLFVPRRDHRVDALARLTEDSRSTVLRGEEGQQLGLVGATGLALLLATVALAAAGRAGDRAPWPTLRRLGVLSTGLILVATVSGGSLALAGMGLRIIRAWDRVSIVLGFCGIAAAALVADAAVRALRARGVPRSLLGVVGVVVLAVGLVDQTASADRPRWSEQQAHVADARRFFGSIADAVGPDGAVWVLPHRFFPESGLQSYDGMVGYLFEPRLRWSTGFMTGRHPEYPTALAALPVADRYDAVAAIGFDAVWLDRDGVPDADAVAAELTALLGPPVATSDDGLWSWWDLRPYAADVRRRLGDDGMARLAAESLRRQPDG